MSTAAPPRHATVVEAAVPAGEDPVRYAALLDRIRDASLAGDRPPARPRAVIDRSWARVRDAGVDPDQGRLPVDPVVADEVEHRRRGGQLGRVIPVLTELLMPAAEDAGHVMVVVDRDGVILWRDGPRDMARRAESLGFCTGADWREQTVGTNAIGTALAVDHPVQVYASEHFVASHHDWTCAAAPIHDPATGELLGVVDVSGAAATVHPATLSLVDAAARVAQHQLVDEQRARLDRLRAVAAPLLARTGGRALVTDRDGWVGASIGLAAPARIALPTQDCQASPVQLAALGTCRFEPVPGGWLIRVVGPSDDSTVTLQLQLDTEPAHAVVDTASGRFTHRLRPRQAELLGMLARHPAGRTAAQLSADLFGATGHEVAVRAEANRLRTLLGPLIVARPYRFASWVGVNVRSVQPSASHGVRE